MFEITLMIEGQPKTFTQPFVSGRALRKTLEHHKALTEAAKQPDFDEIKDMEMCAEWVSMVFGGQFSPSQFEDGVASHKFYTEYWRLRGLVQTGQDNAFKAFMPTEDNDPNG